MCINYRIPEFYRSRWITQPTININSPLIYYLVCFETLSLDGQRHIRKGFRVQQLIEHRQHVRLMVVPSQTEPLRCHCVCFLFYILCQYLIFFTVKRILYYTSSPAQALISHTHSHSRSRSWQARDLTIFGNVYHPSCFLLHISLRHGELPAMRIEHNGGISYGVQPRNYYNKCQHYNCRRTFSRINHSLFKVE